MGEFTKRQQQPYRFDTVGSFLRPAHLKEARQAFEAGEIDGQALRQVEDEAIIKLIQKQEEAGLKAVSDGEFRRSWWHYDFMWGLNGIEKRYIEEGGQFHDMKTRAETASLTSRELDGHNHPFVEDFKFVRDHKSAASEVKQTIPAPAQLLQELLKPHNQASTQAFYGEDEHRELAQAIAKAYIDVLEDFAAEGATVVQFDDCTWGRLVDIHLEDYPESERQAKADEKAYLAGLYRYVNNLAIDGAPEGLTITSHVCRGNYRSHWFGQGGYDSVADELFANEHAQAYYLEYDSDRAGGFEPLAKIGDDRVVVLGLITSKTGELEDRDQVIQRIHEAAKYIPLDKLCLSPQCGFSSTEEGNSLTEDQQWAKIALVRSIAEEVWG
ncbi:MULTISPECIES: 5-methyltetrahydropteroyltriglutamate--homocysteine S-methyltransferase [Aerococcus]|uniref:5-methyltetrahydropteroyltriglutamate--homocysteine S-methyltransferase n=1 Tax=Aerococcus sanguinicola TaxID=119206 RepID=A0A5N1GHU3_9LACT|nr:MULTISPECIES: 5-methyltetrahydropteroyltriglutamate--homocysteine S-methyltransferase [Aerococcus]KAA9299739.1 5-methyltetrahydropteroyltriglutamate--homocysteine S-methyltransferase [Aerococcus sanguinicola]MDK6369939.1 5-methyltetrahydropteroyltriglutamate--homocysteine S-methyltransferase [Aerococcus sp. UMB9870]MDK6680587.1 5-methyltetrahydropteroyltriglutamate--homocysteine S-methyltransferase [Aerococcus sp. UMB8608]MDK6687314.1 5-methyltetrahydropteroyltriglutamate--homocysteine S-met